MQATGQTAILEEAQLTARRIFDLISPELALVEEEFELQAQVLLRTREKLEALEARVAELETRQARPRAK